MFYYALPYKFQVQKVFRSAKSMIELYEMKHQAERWITVLRVKIKRERYKKEIEEIQLEQLKMIEMYMAAYTDAFAHGLLIGKSK